MLFELSSRKACRSISPASSAGESSRQRTERINSQFPAAQPGTVDKVTDDGEIHLPPVLKFLPFRKYSFLSLAHGGAVLHGALPKSRIPVLDILNIMHTFIQNRSCLKKMFSCAGSQSATCRIICIFSHMLPPPEKYPAFFPPSPAKREEHDVQDVQYPNIRHIQYNYL